MEKELSKGRGQWPLNPQGRKTVVNGELNHLSWCGLAVAVVAMGVIIGQCKGYGLECINHAEGEAQVAYGLGVSGAGVFGLGGEVETRKSLVGQARLDAP